LCESQVICDWVEASFPTPALMPADPFEAAKVRELIVFLELHLELVARRLYPQAFFGRTVSEEVQASTRKELERNIKAFSHLAKFSPFVAGSTFTLADCAAIVHLPLITMVGKAIWGEDPLVGLPMKEYLKMVGERPTVARVQEDRKAGQEAFAAYLSGR
jgi:glutathione S-transferase